MKYEIFGPYYMTVIGLAAFKLLSNLIAPAKPGGKDYEALVQTMK